MVTTSVDAPLHMGGHAIKDARIEGGSATGLAQVAAQVLRLDHAPGTKSNPPEGFERPVLVGPGGALELAVLVDAGVVEAFALPHVALTSLADLSAFAGDRAVSPSMFSSTAWRSGGGSCEFSSWALQKPDAR